MPPVAVIHLKYADASNGRWQYRLPRNEATGAKFALGKLLKRGHTGPQFSYVRETSRLPQSRVTLLHYLDTEVSYSDGIAIGDLVTSIDGQIRTTVSRRRRLAVLTSESDAQGTPCYRSWTAAEAAIAWYTRSGPFEIFTGWEPLVIRREPLASGNTRWKYIFETNVSLLQPVDDVPAEASSRTTASEANTRVTITTDDPDDTIDVDAEEASVEFEQMIADSERALLALMALVT